LSDAAGTLWIVSAPSGAGKTSLTRALVQRLRDEGVDAAISVSYTTRAARPGEAEGEHYHFVTPAVFEQMVTQRAFLEHAEVFGRRYGTGREATERRLAAGCELFLDIDWQGARQLRGQLADACSVFILPPSLATLEQRLRGRGQDGEAVIAQRMREAREELSHYAEYQWLVVNDDFDTALAELHALVVARRLRLAAQQARHAALIAALLDR